MSADVLPAEWLLCADEYSSAAAAAVTVEMLYGPGSRVCCQPSISAQAARLAGRRQGNNKLVSTGCYCSLN